MAAFLILKKKIKYSGERVRIPQLQEEEFERYPFLLTTIAHLEPLTLLSFDLYLVDFEMSTTFLSVS